MENIFDSKAKIWDASNYRIERAEVISTSIKKNIPVSKNWKLLDFGCGTGLLGFNFINDVAEVWFADNSTGMLEEVNQKLRSMSEVKSRTINLDQEEPLEFEIDCILSSMVLHHIENVERQIEKLAKWLPIGGYICLCDLDKEDGSFHQDEIVPHNGFERNEIKDFLMKANCEIIYETTVYRNKKKTNDKIVEYPVFMIIAKKLTKDI